jgi:hypothetical protein
VYVGNQSQEHMTEVLIVKRSDRYTSRFFFKETGRSISLC